MPPPVAPVIDPKPAARENPAVAVDPARVAVSRAAGQELLEIAPLPPRFSYSSFATYAVCPLRYAFSYLYRLPIPDRPIPAFAFGNAAHEVFATFTRERRERQATNIAPLTREDLNGTFWDRWNPTAFGDARTEEWYRGRVGALLDNFWTGELRTDGETIAEELPFELIIENPAGGEPVAVAGVIDRIDRLPSGAVEVIDYKTGRPGSQTDVDASLQLSIYALACRDALNLGTPARVTLYFPESATRLSTTRTDHQLDAVRADLVSRSSSVRSGDLAATPSVDACRWCDYAAECPSRASFDSQQALGQNPPVNR